MIPDKIYIGTVTLSSNAPSEEHLLPDWHLKPNPKIANIEYIRKKAILKFIYDMIDQLNDRHLLDAALHCALNGIIEEIESM